MTVGRSGETTEQGAATAGGTGVTGAWAAPAHTAQTEIWLFEAGVCGAAGVAAVQIGAAPGSPETACITTD